MRIHYSLILGFGISLASAGSATAQTLFSYGNNPVSKEEFVRVYQKNNAQKQPDFSEKSVREYLDLYSLFRMKVKEAELMKLDTTEAVRNELENYRNQLSRTFLVDKETTSKLVDEAYARMKEEIKTQHILVALRPGEDSTVAYKKIDSIYTAITSGKASFDDMATRYSDDKGSGAKGGNIGYITALQVVYPFENAAYNTAVGQVSRPFRTQFGYHILKVNDRRAALGKVQVAHILIATPKSDGEAGVTAARTKIAEIQAELKAGKSFEDLATTYSQDKYSQENKGMLEPFGAGKMVPEFETAAFALRNPGDVSEPIQTEFGIHLIKLIKKIPLQPLDEIKDNLARKVENDSRSAVAKEAFQNQVKKEYKFKDYPENIAKLIEAIPSDSLREKGFKAQDYTTFNATVIELNGKKHTQYDFMKYAAEITRGRIAGTKNTAFNDLMRMYENKLISDLQLANLEKNNAEYRNLITEYRDGILLFDLMDKNVWSKASKDTAGLDRFFAAHESKYMWQPGFEGTVYQAVDKDFLDQFVAEVNGGASTQDALDKINIPQNPNRITQQTGRFEFSGFSLPTAQYTSGKLTPAFVNPDGIHTAIFVSELHSTAEQKSLSDARGFVVADYQDELEKTWAKELREKYPLKVNDKTMKSITK